MVLHRLEHTYVLCRKYKINTDIMKLSCQKKLVSPQKYMFAPSGAGRIGEVKLGKQS